MIDADGSVHPLSSNLVLPGVQRSSSLVWTGDHYLAVWNDMEKLSLVAAPLSSEGMLTGEVQSLTSFPQDVSPAGLGWNGHHALVAFTAPGGMKALMLDANGQLIRSVAVPSSQASVAVAAAGDTFAIVWAGQAPAPAVKQTNVYLERFDGNGAPIDAGPVTLASNLQLEGVSAAVASNGSQFGVAFMTATDGTLQRLRVDRLSGAIDRLPPAPFALFNNQLVGVFWSGDDFVAYATDVNNIDTLRFTSDTVRMLDVSPIFINTPPQVVQGPGGALAIWNDSRPSNSDNHILGAMLDRDATTITQRDLTVSRSAVPQTHPVLASSPAGALLVWDLERGDERADIVATRLDPSGNPLDGTPIAIAVGATFSNPSVVWAGNFYLVVFPYGPSIAGKRISPTGVVLDKDPIVFGHGDYAAAASNGATTIVAISEGNSVVKVVRLNTDGSVIDTQPVFASRFISRYLAVATNGQEFVVAWTEGKSDGFVLQDDIYAVRLGATGLPIDASPIAVATTGLNETEPAIASDGRDFLIAYTDDANLRMKRLLREGTVVDALAVVAGFRVTTPQIAFQASRYVLTWTDQYLFSPNSDASEARAVTVSSEGAILDPPFVLAQNDSLFSLDTAVASGLVVYSRSNGAEEGIPRLFARQIFVPQVRGRAVRH
ncbi:MAG TPA: hypothetical protein VGR95_01890 [Thermoanaerobaculia bacterium]|nr:hypothetical protein [Thermoanaerobaculia bacterium]